MHPYAGSSELPEQQHKSFFNESSRLNTSDAGVKGRLEQYSRRLSQLGLVDTNESSSSEREEVITNDSHVIEKNRENIKKGPSDIFQVNNASESVKSTGNGIPGGFGESVLENNSQSNITPAKVQKVKIKFQPIGSIAPMYPSVCLISASKPFSMIINFLRKKLRVNTIYCYVNNSFAPVPNQNVGDLWSQFKVNDELIISYCGTVAFG